MGEFVGQGRSIMNGARPDRRTGFAVFESNRGSEILADLLQIFGMMKTGRELVFNYKNTQNEKVNAHFWLFYGSVLWLLLALQLMFPIAIPYLNK